MDPIRLEPTDETPEVILDKGAGQFRLAGKSLPEDAADFYEPLIDWVDAYAADPLPETVFEIHLFYYNTASSKLLLDLLVRLEEMHIKRRDSGCIVRIKWIFDEDDEDMEDAGVDYDDVIEIPFEMIAIP